MVRFRTLSVAAALVGCSLTPALAQNQPLDVRPGLWEFSTQRSMTGMPKMPEMPAIPPEVLAKMPPAQRARIEAALKARSGANGKHVSKVCFTAESLRRGPTFEQPPRDANCQRTKNTRTAHGWQLREVCHRGGSQQAMDIRYRVVTRETIDGTVNVAMHQGGRNVPMKQVTHARWLGPDCGKVKPIE